MWTVSAKRAGRLFRGFPETATWFTSTWYKDEANMNRQRHESVVDGALRNGRRVRNSRGQTVVDETKQGKADMVARYKTEYRSK